MAKIPAPLIIAVGVGGALMLKKASDDRAAAEAAQQAEDQAAQSEWSQWADTGAYPSGSTNAGEEAPASPEDATYDPWTTDSDGDGVMDAVDADPQDANIRSQADLLAAHGQFADDQRVADQRIYEQQVADQEVMFEDQMRKQDKSVNRQAMMFGALSAAEIGATGLGLYGGYRLMKAQRAASAAANVAKAAPKGAVGSPATGARLAFKNATRSLRTPGGLAKAAYVGTGIYTAGRNLGETAAAVRFAVKGDKEKAANLAAKSIQRGTTYLSGGVASFKPDAKSGRTRVRVLHKKFDIKGPSSVKGAGKNLKRNVSTGSKNIKKKLKKFKFW